MPTPAAIPLPAKWARVLDQTRGIGRHAWSTACKSESEVLFQRKNGIGDFNKDWCDGEFMGNFWNWESYLAAERPEPSRMFEGFETVIADACASGTFAFAAAESGVDERKLREIAEIVSKAGMKRAAHNSRSAAAGAEGGWQAAPCPLFHNCLMGTVACEDGT